MQKPPYQRRLTPVTVAPMKWTMARPETIRASLAATRAELERADGHERDRIENRIAALEHALRLSR